MRSLVKGGTVVTAAERYKADVLIEGGRIRAIGEFEARDADMVIDAEGKYVMPGAIDIHTHFDMPFGGTVTADDFRTGSVAAACGGTTTIIDWACQEKGKSLREAIHQWRQKADGKTVIDYSLHAIITDLREEVMDEIPLVVDEGITSLKCFTAYKGSLMIDDGTLFRILRKARECGALVCVHCENGDVIDVLVQEYLAQGKVEPLYHALSRPPQAEGEATGRAIALAEMAGAPLFVVHLSAAQALERVSDARARGLPVYAETCPQYLVLDVDRYTEPDFAGAKYVCSPPLRERWHQERLWKGLAAGDLSVVGSDHCSFNFKGQKELGLGNFAKIPNGLPGVEHRVGLLYTSGVVAGRISLNRFVELVSTGPAKIFGLYPKKGTVAVGSDGDLMIFDPEAEVVISAANHHMNVDYNPYEGFKLQGAPTTVLLRGTPVVENGQFVGREGAGEFVKRQRFSLAL